MITMDINGFEWKVQFVEENHEALVNETGEPAAFGITLLQKGEIYIESDLPKGLAEKIVTHEVVHAIAFSYGIDLDLVDEEKICDFIGTYFNVIQYWRSVILGNFNSR